MSGTDGTSELAKALAELQLNLPSVATSKKVDVAKDGRKQFDYRYAPLNEVHDVILPAMSKVGLAWFTIPDMVDGKFGLRTKLLHASGEFEPGFFPFPPQSDMQKVGSAITYARRYSILCATGLMPDEDDDGASASRPIVNKVVVKGSIKEKTPADDFTISRKLLDDAIQGFTVAQKEWLKARATELGIDVNNLDSQACIDLVSEIDRVKAERAGARETEDKRNKAAEERADKLVEKPETLVKKLFQLGPQAINRHNISAGTALEKEGKVIRTDGDPRCWKLTDGEKSE